MKLAAVQYRPPHGAADQARPELAALVDEAGRAGAGLIVCPEMAVSGYVFDDAEEILPHTEAPEGPSFAALSPLAAAHGAWVVYGFAERAEDGLFNSAAVIGPDGRLVCTYRKVLLFEADETWAQPGRRRLVVDAPFGRLAPGICMDLNDPGFNLYLRRAQPHVLAFCTNWVDEGDDILDYWRARLWPWRGWFVAADRWGEERGTRFYGRSTILAPGGRVVAMAGPEGDGVIYGEMPED